VWKKLEVADAQCEWIGGEMFEPLATFEDGLGGRIQIGEDDHCLLMGVLRTDACGRTYYKPSAWIPPEVARAMAALVP